MMICKYKGKRASETNHENGCSCVSAGEIYENASNTLKTVMIEINNNGDTYPQRVAIESLMTAETSDASLENTAKLWKDWIERSLTRINRLRDRDEQIKLTPEEMDELVAYYQLSTIEAINIGAIEKKDSSELWDELPFKCQHLVVALDNESSIYESRLQQERLTIPDPIRPASDELLISWWKGWIRRGLNVVSAYNDFEEPFTKEELEKVARFYLQDARERIASGEIRKLTREEMLREDERKPKKIKNVREVPPEKVEELLTQALPDGNYLRLNQNLDRQTYVKVATILEKLGGKWKRNVQAFEFPYDASEALQSFLKTKKFPDPNPHDFYRTPDALSADTVEKLGDIKPNARILEPSAGDGAIARAVLNKAPDASVDVIEIDEGRREKLRADGFNLVADDFLNYWPDEGYDYIPMNPPFRNGIFADHILHAYELLKPGGTLVAIAPVSVEFANTQKIQAVRALNPKIIKLPEGSFRESGTEVQTVQVIIQKLLE